MILVYSAKTAIIWVGTWPCREFLETSKADKRGLHFDILECYIVVWKIEYLADNDSAFFAVLFRNHSLVLDLLRSILVLNLSDQYRVAVAIAVNLLA